MSGTSQNASKNSPPGTRTVQCPHCFESFAVPFVPARITGHQITVRAKFITDGAKIGPFGQATCPLCQRVKKSRWNLVNHLRRDHREELEQMEAKPA